MEGYSKYSMCKGRTDFFRKDILYAEGVTLFGKITHGLRTSGESGEQSWRSFVVPNGVARALHSAAGAAIQHGLFVDGV